MAMIKLDGQTPIPGTPEICYHGNNTSVCMVTNVTVTIATEETFLWEGSIDSH